MKDDFVEEHKYSNPVISLWTTSAARLFLHGALQKVADTPGCEILYMDTDSVIYVHPEENDPLPIGPHLGDLTDEYPEHEIVEYVSGGCKNYALKYCKKSINHLSDTSSFQNIPYEYSLKIRGLTLDDNTCKLIHYESFRSQVLAFCSSEPANPIIVSYPNSIAPTLKTGTVHTINRTKMFRPVVTKGIVRPSDSKVIHYGSCNT
jgi:hypothetical protein